MSELAKAWEPEYQVVLTTTDTDVNPAQSFPVGFRANTMEATMREADMHFNPDLGTSHEEIDDFFSTNSVISGTTFYTAPTRDDPKRTSRKLKG